MSTVFPSTIPFVPNDEQALETILDALDALVYVADIHTHELVFLNKFGRQHWGQVHGQRCWEVLQKNQSGPCEFCTNPKLLNEQQQPNGYIHVWEFQNTVTGRWYQCRDQAVNWVDGRLVRIEVAVDITDRKLLEQELIDARRQAEMLAETDSLTTIYNRRAFFSVGKNIIAKKSHLHTSLIMIDMDYFKQINDTYGHAAGDAALIHVTQLCQRNLRDTDLFARLGGEEFAILLPKTDLAQARETAERLRSVIESTPLLFNGHLIECTASFGISHYQPGTPINSVNDLLLDEMLSVADSQLYEAKRAGRNRIISAHQPVQAPSLNA